MDQIINFRASIDTFTKYEFELFCYKLYKEYDKRELIIKSLFHLFLEESKQYKYKNVSKINKITKTILDLRKKTLSSQSLNNNNPSNANNTKTAIIDLPSQLIAYTASYLKSQQTSLIKCNRYIFSSLTSSLSRIQKLDQPNWFTSYKNNHGPQYCPYQMAKLSRLRMVKDITVCFADIPNEFYQSFPCNKLNLDILRLTNIYISSELYNESNERESAKIINICNQIGRNYKTLELKASIAVTAQNYFTAVMQSNTNIECLSLDVGCGYERDNNLIPTAMSKVNLMTKLKGLIIVEDKFGCLIPSILPLIGKQLISLHLNAYYFSIILPPNIMQLMLPPNKTFDNLQELCLNEYVPDHIVVAIVNSAKHLQRFCWEIHHESTRGNIEHVLQTIVSEREEINYLNICSSIKQFEILNTIFSKNKYKRNNMKIRWYSYRWYNWYSHKYFKNVLKFVNALNDSVRNDFMFIFKYFFFTHDKQLSELDGTMETVLDDVKNLYSIKTTTNYNLKTAQKQIVICNKGNKMCGYRESWLYPCKQCNKQS